MKTLCEFQIPISYRICVSVHLSSLLTVPACSCKIETQIKRLTFGVAARPSHAVGGAAYAPLGEAHVINVILNSVACLWLVGRQVISRVPFVRLLNLFSHLLNPGKNQYVVGYYKD